MVTRHIITSTVYGQALLYHVRAPRDILVRQWLLFASGVTTTDADICAGETVGDGPPDSPLRWK